MIRIELFLDILYRFVGVEAQFFRLNAQLNLGLRLVLQWDKKPGAIFIGFGPLVIVAWVDGRPVKELIRHDS